MLWKKVCRNARKKHLQKGGESGAHPRSLALTGERGGRRGRGVYPLGGPERSSGGRLQSLPLRLFQERHVDVAVILLPPLVLLDDEVIE
jgi:hypothetical protein